MLFIVLVLHNELIIHISIPILRSSTFHKPEEGKAIRFIRLFKKNKLIIIIQANSDVLLYGNKNYFTYYSSFKEKRMHYEYGVI